MTTLRIEPVQQPETSCTEYSLIDETNSEVAVVTGREWAQKFAAADSLYESLSGLFDSRGCERANLDGSHVISASWLEVCRAAIAKFEGRS